MTHRSLILTFVALLVVPNLLSVPNLIAAEPAFGPDAEAIHTVLRQLDRTLDRRLEVAAHHMAEGTFEADSLRQDADDTSGLLNHLEAKIQLLGSEEATILQRKLELFRLRVRDLEVAAERGKCPPVARSAASAAGFEPIRITHGDPRRGPTPPPNDACENATVIGTLGTFLGDTSDATNDGEASCGSSLFGPDVWFKIEVTQNGPVFVDTVGSALDTVLSIHTSCPGTVINEQSCNDDIFGDASAVGFFGTVGTERWVRVSGFGNEAGTYTLNVGSGGSLSGTVIDNATSDPLPNINVTLVNGEGFSVGTQTTDAIGSYTFDDLSPGGFYAFTSNNSGYINEVYNDVTCMPTCDPTLGELVLVENEMTTTDINFALDLGGSLSGTVTAASAEGGGINNLRIEVWDAAGEFVNAAMTDTNGDYTIDKLATGNYFVSTNSPLFLNELYDNLPCPSGLPFGCDATTGTPVAVSLGTVSPGINFELDRQGSITGTVTDTLSGDPLTSVFVEAYDTDGSRVAFAYTDGAGFYELGGLVAGSYFVGTDGFFDQIDELYDNIPCPGGPPFGCDLDSGTPVVVTLNATTPGINFVLDQRGALAGTLTEDGSGDPIPFVRVEAYRANGSFAGSASSDASGLYEIDGLDSNTYFATTDSSQVVNELFDDLPCQGGCDPTTGSPIAVTVNSTVDDIDFTLVSKGKITGTVTREENGLPVSFRRVEVRNTDGFFVRSTSTDANGLYVVQALDDGDYFVSTDVSTEGLLDELFDDIPCLRGAPFGCDATTGTPVTVAAGTAATGIDFALGTGGVISGTLTDAETGDPIDLGRVRIYDTTGSEVRAQSSNSSGDFAIGGLDTGTYYATAQEDGHRRELYDDMPCIGGCNPLTGTPIVVTVGSTTAGIDFALEPLGGISGTVTDAATGTLEDTGFIDLFNSAGNFVDSAFFGPSGAYEFDNVEPGTYFARTVQFFSIYANQLYDGLPCQGNCDPTTGTPIVVTLGTTTTGIDFALERTGAISGVVQSSAGLPAANVEVRIWDGAGTFISSTASDATGLYTVRRLPAGSYFATTSSGAWIDQLFNGLPCEGGCDPTAGQPIRVTSSTTTRHVNFSLDRGGAITGTVSRTSGGPPITNEFVVLWDANGLRVNSEFTNGVGVYVFDGLLPGTYYVSTAVGSSFLEELYDDIPCPGGAPSGCDPTTGQPIAVTNNTTVSGIDFALSTLGTLTGTVTDVANGVPLRNIRVVLWDTDSQFVDLSFSNSDGNYLFDRLEPGTYFVTTGNTQGYLDELYDNLPCYNGAPAGCEPDKGTPIPVALDSVVTGINFELLLTSTGLTGTVTDQATGEPLPNVLIDIWNTAGIRVTTAITGAAGTYFVSLPTNAYFASTDANSGLLMDEIYDDISCPAPAFGSLCDATTGTAISVTSSGTAGDPGVTDGIDFSLGSSIVFSDGFETGDTTAWSNSTDNE